MIRDATPADRDALAALHLASWQANYGTELDAAFLRDVPPGEMAAR